MTWDDLIFIFILGLIVVFAVLGFSSYSLPTAGNYLEYASNNSVYEISHTSGIVNGTGAYLVDLGNQAQVYLLVLSLAVIAILVAILAIIWYQRKNRDNDPPYYPY